MAKLTTVYWREIPAQVIAKQGRASVKIPLSERFHHAIDRAAMRAGKGGSEAYLEEWRREVVNCTSDLQTAAESRAEQLEDSYSDEMLKTMIRAKGFAEVSAAGEEST